KVHPIGKRILHPEIPLLVLSEHEGDFHPIQKGTDEPVFIHAPTVSHPPERHSATVFSIGMEMGNATVFIANRKKGTGKKPDLRQVFPLLFTRSRCLVTEHGGQRQSPHFKTQLILSYTPNVLPAREKAPPFTLRPPNPPAAPPPKQPLPAGRGICRPGPAPRPPPLPSASGQRPGPFGQRAQSASHSPSKRQRRRRSRLRFLLAESARPGGASPAPSAHRESGRSHPPRR